jgi:nucleotide-binding universal stress UspA family protein
MSLRIMVAVDANSQNDAAMELAARWVKRLGGSVTGLGVVDESIWAPAPVLATGNTPLQPPDNTALERAKKHVEQGLERLKSSCVEAEVDYRQFEAQGVPHEEILAEAQGHDLILFGTTSTPDPGLGVPARSVLENILRNSPRPVVAVPDRAEKGEGILVAYDGSLQAARALQAFFGCGLAALDGVRVLSVDENSEDEARRNATPAVRYLAGHRIEPDLQIEVTDKPAHRVIVDEAHRQGAEIIVMGAYGRSRLAEFFMGSVTTGVIDESLVPVFLFH